MTRLNIVAMVNCAIDIRAIKKKENDVTKSVPFRKKMECIMSYETGISFLKLYRLIGERAC